MIKPLMVFILILSLDEPLSAQGDFNWLDTPLIVGHTRTIQLMRAFDGPCTVKPCYEYGKNKPTYDTLVSFLTRNKDITVAFLCHTWTIDDSAYNLEISKRMAQGLIAELVRQGINDKRIVAIGLGESRPLVSESELKNIQDDKIRSETDRKNWRIEVVITSIP